MVRAVKAERAVDVAVANLREAIIDGEFACGTFLPPERALAETLGINRLTLRAALSRLEAEGLVRPEHGNGVRVLDAWSQASLAVLPHLVAARGREWLEDFLELRRILAAEAVLLCAERASDEVRDQLLRLAEEQAVENDREAFARRDLRFARALVEGAGNLAMVLLLNSVEAVLEATPELMEAMLGDLDEVRDSYGQVAALVAAGGPLDGAARDAVRARLEAQDARTMARVREGAARRWKRGGRE